MAVGVFLLAFMLASLLYAVCLNAAEKRIPVQYAGKTEIAAQVPLSPCGS